MIDYTEEDPFSPCVEIGCFDNDYEGGYEAPNCECCEYGQLKGKAKELENDLQTLQNNIQALNNSVT